MKIFRVNAFTETQVGGNPAGVVLEADSYSEENMLETAKAVGYSETAFIMKSQKADFKIKYFTPSDEVDLCGHATIACFTVLLEEKVIQPGLYTIETKAGILPIDVNTNGVIKMTQLKPKSYESIPNDLIAKSLGLISSDLIGPSQVYSTGLKDIMVHVKDKNALASITADYEAISNISKTYDSTGYHVFTLDSDLTASCRNFAPLYAINEESATGSASGAVSGYILEHKLIDHSDGLHHLIFEQGIEMELPSIIHTYITIENNTITNVVVGGKGKIQPD